MTLFRSAWCGSYGASVVRLPLPPAHFKLVRKAGRGIARKPCIKRKSRVRAEDNGRQAANLPAGTNCLRRRQAGVSAGIDRTTYENEFIPHHRDAAHAGVCDQTSRRGGG